MRRGTERDRPEALGRRRPAALRQGSSPEGRDGPLGTAREAAALAGAPRARSLEGRHQNPDSRSSAEESRCRLPARIERNETPPIGKNTAASHLVERIDGMPGTGNAS